MTIQLKQFYKICNFQVPLRGALKGHNHCENTIKKLRKHQSNATSGYINPSGWGNVNSLLLCGFKNRLTGNLFIKSTYAREGQHHPDSALLLNLLGVAQPTHSSYLPCWFEYVRKHKIAFFGNSKPYNWKFLKKHAWTYKQCLWYFIPQNMKETRFLYWLEIFKNIPPNPQFVGVGSISRKLIYKRPHKSYEE